MAAKTLREYLVPEEEEEDKITHIDHNFIKIG